MNQTYQSIMIVLADKIPAESISIVKQRLTQQNVDLDELFALSAQMKDPTIALILSIVLGYLGVDRFYNGDIGLGLGKLFTCGGLYVWWLIDIFFIMKAVREKNLIKLLRFLDCK